MSHILILGGYSATGKPLTKHLLSQTNYNILIAGRNLGKSQAFVDFLQDPRLTAKQVDATDPASLREALRGVDFLLVAAPTTHYKDTGFYISGSNPLADMLVTPIVSVGLKVAPNGGIRPLGKLMWWAMGKSKPPYRVVRKVEEMGQ